MRDSFPFLIRLGLRPDVDAKDIRRAYSRELKKIDQEADPTGFQELREAYETALNWHAHMQFEAAQQAAQDTPSEPLPEQAPVAAPPPVPDPALVMEQEDPYQLADQAFEKLLASTGMLVQRNDSRNRALWKAVLQRSLDDDRLLNLTARAIFEARIIQLLASGWKPGHETLFVVANDIFEWERDRNRILQFGEAGGMVNRAIDEWKVYESLPPGTVSTFKQLINFIRTTPDPSNAGRNDLMLFHQMASRFYTWLAVIIDRQILEAWGHAANTEVERNGPGTAVPMERSEPEWQPEPEAKSDWARPGLLWPLFLVIVFVVRSCFSTVDEDTQAKRFARTTQAAPQYNSAQGENPPSKEHIERIRASIKYQWPANAAAGKYAVEYEVYIDSGGNFLGTQLVTSSGDAGYDAAVRKAIKDSTPFVRGTATAFRLRYSMEITKPEPPKGKRASKAQLQAVQDEIFYVPGAAIKDGVLKVGYELELNDQGRVISLKKLKASRDPNFDEVVADALRETRAFPPDTLRKFNVEYARTIQHQ
ncbi:TonB C-terminal domain-containing protein [Massilia sp. SR12]